MRVRKIYVASSWRNQIQPDVVESLRIMGHEVYDFKNPPNGAGFGWEQISSDWKNWSITEYMNALNHELAIKGFCSDFEAMKHCDLCILVLPCGRSAHSEAGWMKGQGKEVYVLSMDQTEPELMYKMFDGIFDRLIPLLSKIQSNNF